ncbi:cyclodeaminase/cyclohydrolase family protein [Clostridium saccharoperbutylacetonicum]|jgi:formiminotetrahydrofolate cyclodeaminase|nr:cyclodeaminase/cyclohydrolase family protein [Clostridium saccharoperbutylacetonicum]NRT64444.1 formiminotetrahydrofolate cyclodeaminase [Clostridium saccharoperbutylacetonicum]NSB27815.1 formiminotetrahydrofolate cyclodeaminase [Clostridium saccharoperbutylacetonicum]NSB29473.1 formiminotetrahydrofolate cyclodeaminase [Clostridium saccharoperbutylacetonicum]
MKFCEESINQFLEELGSDLSAPGGGSVAGLIAALASALNSMVYSLTVGKKSYIALDDNEKGIINKFQIECREFTTRSLELMEEDRDNFLKLMDSYKLPKETKEEKEKRALSIKENTIKSMEAPLVLARESLEFYKNLNVMAKYGNKMLLSDLGISAILLHSAIESSIVNVKVNLNGLRNEEFFEKIDNELHTIMEKSFSEKNNIMGLVNNIIYPN